MKPRVARALVSAVVVSSALLVGLAAGCVDGVTPDCTGANAAQCAPALDATADRADVSIVLPEASTPVDAGDEDADASDASDEDADAGDGG